MDKNTEFNVTNRSGSIAVYNTEDDHGRIVRRQFAPGQTRAVPYWELEKLTYQSGGAELIANYFLITEKEVLEDLNIPTEPEYFMTKDEIIKLMNFGSLDEFLDALDFAPEGVLQLIKDLAVELPLNDVEKREAIKAKTGFDVTKAIANNRADKEGSAAAGPAQRRVQVADNKPTRRANTTPKYKIVSTQE